MEKTVAGDLVHVAVGRREADGIVFDVSGGTKVIVALIDRSRGPVMRTVEMKDLTERGDAGPDDHALQMLIRRTPGSVRGAARAGAGPGQARAGHKRAATHRTTGK